MKRQHLTSVILLGGLAILAQGGWISGKAMVAQWLMAEAFAETQKTGKATRPWPWADTSVVGRLKAPGTRPLYVLQGRHGEAMAFGPSQINAGNPRAIVLGGHRDTHMRFLGQASVGDVVELTLRDGVTRRYRLSQLVIADTRVDELRIDSEASMLTMITCYPVDAISTGGTQRLIAVALPLATSPQEGQQ